MHRSKLIEYYLNYIQIRLKANIIRQREAKSSIGDRERSEIKGIEKYKIQQMIIDQIIDDVLYQHPIKQQINQFENIIQPNTVKQFLNNLCGYYALYFYQQQENQGLANFWYFYRKMVKTLQVKYPGQVENYEEIQRYHMDYLIETLNLDIVQFLYGFNIIQSPDDQLQALQQKFDQFKEKHIQEVNIVCGITIHWNFIQIRQPNIIVLFDSLDNNVEILFAEEHFESLIKMNQKLGDEGNDLLYAYFKDLRQVLRIMQQLVSGKSIYQVTLDQVIKDIKESYLQYVHSDEQLTLWLKEEYHPKVIHDMLYEPAKRYNLKIDVQFLLDLQHELLSDLQKKLLEIHLKQF
ncbi:hypothetical protein pb186bvf_014582 [Paramecium bursaria]